ncbi:Tripartite-type tricarboxylate transporter, receptor component TctC [Cupriavidus sp. OV038]|jgi:tripartite-type tricarboxylate transporter receptor subunit TctC|uniref:tripartite tricarboxylate transporter substrate binding protein n=1 Tax=unclassified Cupriavidus TaxID=2640874 RepID=UPI0008E7B567|nr:MULTISPECIES: tripartite tricarboxylate transporter substrate binding protein [unclassified Cupriavidus]SFD22435.1 Tripartite-type tricarboxylate transporter, receptor component TctC [Cupriavidus sp. OV038]SFP91747.1 Tripartite-type tricarboxylate transporter, receptor component TctC [Cupriavidus sp. OV096]
MRRQFFRPIAALGVIAALGLPYTVIAQPQYPVKPIRLIVPFSAGSATDILARIIGAKIGEGGQWQVMVDNRPGAGGTLGATTVAKSPPDGYTLILVSVGHAINATLYPKLGYDTLKDFAPVSLVASVPNVLVVNAASPYKSMRDIVAAAKAKPGTLNFDSAGSGSSTHLSGEMFKMRAGIDIVHIPFKGTGEALTDVMAGRGDMMFAPTVSALPFVKQGKLRALAVTTPARAGALPDVPTVAEAGLPGYAFDSWFGVLAPAGTPKEVIQAVNAEIGKALASPDVRERLAAQGAEARASTPQEFSSYIQAEIGKLAPVVKQSGVRAGE